MKIHKFIPDKLVHFVMDILQFDQNKTKAAPEPERRFCLKNGKNLYIQS